MRFGMHLRELSRLPAGVLVSALVALLASVLSVARVSVLPPSIEPRALEMASAYTQVVVDTPVSTIVDLRQSTADIDALKNRAVLVGNVMDSPPVRGFIGRRAHVAPDTLMITTPRTPEAPRPTTQSAGRKGPGDLLKATDQYRLDIQANPTVPVLDIYAQAPTAKAAEVLANAAVDGLGDYLRSLDARTADGTQVRLRQLGRAQGAVLNAGIELKVAFLSFVLVFAVCAAAVIAIGRARRGWLAAKAAES